MKEFVDVWHSNSAMESRQQPGRNSFCAPQEELTQSEGRAGYVVTVDLHSTLVSMFPEEIHACINWPHLTHFRVLSSRSYFVLCRSNRAQVRKGMMLHRHTSKSHNSVTTITVSFQSTAETHDGRQGALGSLLCSITPKFYTCSTFKPFTL